MSKKLAISLALALSSALTGAHANEQHHALPNEGEIRKVDREGKKVTIKHGPLQKLDMPPMTMVFRVSDPALLDQVKPGDTVKFDAEKVNGAFTVTKIEPAR